MKQIKEQIEKEIKRCEKIGLRDRDIMYLKDSRPNTVYYIQLKAKLELLNLLLK